MIPEEEMSIACRVEQNEVQLQLQAGGGRCLSLRISLSRVKELNQTHE